MIVLNCIGIVFYLFGMCSNIFGWQARNQYYGNYYAQQSPALNIIFSLVAIGAGAFAIYALLKMKKAESYTLSLVAVIVSMVPCIGPCFCIGTFAGIWPLVVLLDDQVKSSFTS